MAPLIPCRLSFWWQSKGLTTDQLPFVEVIAYEAGGLLARGEPMAATSGRWRQTELAFTPPADCHAVLVRLRRLPSRRFDSKIEGHVWLDDFEVVCRQGEVHHGDTEDTEEKQSLWWPSTLYIGRRSWYKDVQRDLQRKGKLGAAFAL